MDTVTISELEANLTSILQKVEAGQEVAVTANKNKKIVASLVPTTSHHSQRRRLGILQAVGQVTFSDDFKLTEEEFLGI